MTELFKALVAAQKEFKPVPKNGWNPHFKSKYATLSDCWFAVADALNKHGLAVIQRPVVVDEALQLETMIIHSSGQGISGFYPVNPVKNDPQSMGSAFSYARRYSLKAMLNIADEECEDDGNEATKPVFKAPPPIPKPQQKAPAEKTTTEPQRARLFALGSAHGWDNAQIKDFIGKEFGLESTKELNQQEYNLLCAEIMKSPLVK